jgi:CheY-like chemotaxis protein
VPKILVADDNTNIQKMVTLAFQERGVEVIAVGNGEAAVRRIPDLQPDIVLADVFMPVRNGYEVCEFVKKDERFSHVPVILLVGAFDPLDEREARRVGADGVLKKPFVPPDPLIAMVMSALEKNPKVAAEMAKAREVVAEPPLPPIPAMEIPAKAEPKPLPDYPEPTAEEAAQIYGFGKGVRALDDESEGDESKARAPKAARAKEEDDEFDDSATASDWRRSAADFEVPEEVGGKLAFASDEDFSPTFPSERDVPPRHIRVKDPSEVIEPVEMESNSASAPATFGSLTETASAFASKSMETQVEIAPEPEPVLEPEPEPEPARNFAQSSPAQEIASSEPPKMEAETKQESGFLSKAAHWMDMMAPAPSENSTGGGWMANLLGLHKEPQVAHEPPAAAEQHVTAEPEPAVEAVAEISAVEAKTEEPEPTAPTQTEILSEEPRAAEAESESAPSIVSEPTFARMQRVFESAPDPALEQDGATLPIASTSAVATSDTNEFERDKEDPVPTLRDPMLVESPAVRVEPEPLLVDEEASGPSEYGKRSESMSPLHSFFSPASGDPVLEAPAVEENSARAEFPSIEPAPVEAAADEFNDRIPTAPPPNREALAAIPFLTPPVPTPQEIRSEEASPSQQSTSASDAANTDEMVRRVLEKLQPQLQELLSQGVLKPLVENMLQSELAKKEK